MKHIWGYGLLIVALVVAVVWGCKHCATSAPAPVVAGAPAPHPAPALLQTGHTNSAFEINLMDKAPLQYDREITDHNDYDGADTDIKWTLANDIFTIELVDPICQNATQVNIPHKPPVYDLPPAKDNGDKTFTADCQVSTLWPIMPGKQYFYKVYLTGRATPNGKTANLGGIPTCDGCFIETDPDPDGLHKK